jgi:hypothetical protein
MKLKPNTVYRVVNEFKTWVKEGHEPGGMSTVVTFSPGEKFRTTAATRPGNWIEAQSLSMMRFEPPYGGPSFTWRGMALISDMNVEDVVEDLKERALS